MPASTLAKLDSIYTDILRRNPGEDEFHQAVREVLDSIAPAVAAPVAALVRFVLIAMVRSPQKSAGGIFAACWKTDSEPALTRS